MIISFGNFFGKHQKHRRFWGGANFKKLPRKHGKEEIEHFLFPVQINCGVVKHPLTDDSHQALSAIRVALKCKILKITKTYISRTWPATNTVQSVLR